jgi:hypothetical protein
MRTYQSEFPDFRSEWIPQLPEGFVDTSWHNDACPSFTDDVLGLVVWINYPDADQREWEGSGRYGLTHLDEDGEHAQDLSRDIDSDDWDEIMDGIRQAMRAHVMGIRRTA